MKLSVRLSKKQGYKVPQKDLVNSVRRELIKLGLKDDAELNISIVDERTMMQIAELYLKEKNSIHNVLSFPSKEVKIVFKYPKGITRLGDVVICYKKAIEDSEIEGVSLDVKLIELATHGTRHLMGIHHK